VTDDADRLIEHLGLEPHPEGGWFRETWRDPDREGQRGSGTAIYYLLKAGEQSRWHRVDATEIWHHYAGDVLELSVAGEAPVLLGLDIDAGQVPQAVVPADAWQAARPLGRFTLVGCTVSPAFRFEGFELAPGDGAPPTPTDP
jgi:predicted cupin superfamily sugar epimerase